MQRQNILKKTKCNHCKNKKHKHEPNIGNEGLLKQRLKPRNWNKYKQKQTRNNNQQVRVIMDM